MAGVNSHGQSIQVIGNKSGYALALVSVGCIVANMAMAIGQ